MEVDSKKLQQLYIAFLGRPADPPGIQFWLLQVKKGIELTDIAYQLSIQDEYKKYIMYGKNIEFQINQVYLNLFSRKADFAKLSYWLGSIQSGVHDISDLVCDLICTSLDLSQNNNYQEILDQKTLENKVEHAELFTKELGSTINGVNL